MIYPWLSVENSVKNISYVIHLNLNGLLFQGFKRMFELQRLQANKQVTKIKLLFICVLFQNTASFINLFFSLLIN